MKGFKFAFILFLVPVFAQYEDLVTLPDAPTRTAEQQNVQCALEGLQVVKKSMEGGTKNVSLAFLLTRKPSVYFNYYDAKKKAIVFDFYDTHIGESPLDSIREAPITGSTVEFFRSDLNKDVAGLKPDFRDIVRVSLYTPYALEYDVQEDQGLITMSFKWSGKKETQFKRQSTAFFWELPVAVIAAGGVGFAAYELFLKKSSDNTDPLPCCPAPRPASP